MSKPYRSISFDEIAIHEYAESLKGARPRYLLLSFPDTGLVSSISGRHLVVNGGLKLVGEIDSRHLSHISVIHDGVAMSPIQVYASPMNEVLLVLSEIPVPLSMMNQLINAILEYSASIGVENLLAITGLAVPNRLQIERPSVFLLSSGVQINARELGFEELKEGFITGPYAVLIREARRRGLNAILIFVESFYDIPDPEAAAVGLTALSKITGLRIDVSKLLEEAELLKLKTRDLMRQTREAMSSLEKELEKHMPLMYT